MLMQMDRLQAKKLLAKKKAAAAKKSSSSAATSLAAKEAKERAAKKAKQKDKKHYNQVLSHMHVDHQMEPLFIRQELLQNPETLA